MKKKFYKKAKPRKDKKFPRNYRSIPEKLNRDESVFFIGFLSILIAILLISLDLYSNFERQKKLSKERVKIFEEIGFWQSEAKLHPNFRDAYLNLALLNFQMKNFVESKKNLDKSLELDPNFEEGRELQQILDSK